MSDHYDPSLDAIARTDRFVDALASGARMSSVDPLSAMLGSWRDDVRSQPDDHVVTLEQASAALAQAQKPVRRNRVGLTVVGAAAAAVLCLGGFGAVVYDAGPGEALYGLRSVLFGESAAPRTDAVVLAAQELEQVQQLVDQGKWDEAQQKLISIASTVQSVDNTPGKQELVAQYNSLTAKVIERNPAATPPPPDAPPQPANPQSPLSFLPVPVIETPTTSSPSTDPNLMISPSSDTSSPTSPSSSPTSPSSSPSPTPSSSPSTSPSPTPSSSPSSSPSPTPTSSSATPSSSPSASSSANPAPAIDQSATSPTATPAPTVTSPAVAVPTPSAAAPSAGTASAVSPATPAQPKATPSAADSSKNSPLPTPTSAQPEPKQQPEPKHGQAPKVR